MESVPDNEHVNLCHGSFRSDMFSLRVSLRYDAALDGRFVSEPQVYSIHQHLANSCAV